MPADRDEQEGIILFRLLLLIKYVTKKVIIYLLCKGSL